MGGPAGASVVSLPVPPPDISSRRSLALVHVRRPSRRRSRSAQTQLQGNGTLQAAHVDVDLHHYRALLVFIGTQTIASVLCCRQNRRPAAWALMVKEGRRVPFLLSTFIRCW